MDDETGKELLNDVKILRRDTTEIKTVLMGYDDHPGLCNQVHEVRKDFYTFRRIILIVAAFLVGTGLLSIGVIEVLKGLFIP